MGMKKFLTRIPLQAAGNLKRMKYVAADNEKLQMEAVVSFPILTAVNGFVKDGEDFEILAVVADSPAEEHNYEELCSQVHELFGEAKGEIKVTKIAIEAGQGLSEQVGTFQKLIDEIEDDDELFVCMTFGTKPQSQVMMMAAQYAYRVKNNVSIECVLYGEIDRSQGVENAVARVYDMTGLVQLDEAVRILGERKVRHPERIIRNILSL